MKPIEAALIRTKISYYIEWRCLKCNFENIHVVESMDTQHVLYCNKCSERSIVMARNSEK